MIDHDQGVDHSPQAGKHVTGVIGTVDNQDIPGLSLDNQDIPGLGLKINIPPLPDIVNRARLGVDTSLDHNHLHPTKRETRKRLAKLGHYLLKTIEDLVITLAQDQDHLLFVTRK